MNSPHRMLRSAALAAMFLLSAPVAAQGGLLGHGFGAFVAQNQQTHLFAFAAVEGPTGSVRGSCVVLEPATNGLVRIEVSSKFEIGSTLMLAGTITMAVNAPPQFAVGATGAFAVNDNGCCGTPPDSFLGVVAVPLSFGNLTARQIVALIGPPPPEMFSPLLFGDIRL